MLRDMYRGICVTVALAVVAMCEVSAQQNRDAGRDFELGRSIEILANIVREFEVGYVEDVAPDALLSAAVNGIVVATDPYSQYLSEEDMKDFEVMTTGRYGGVGSLIRKRGDYVFFAQPYKGSPSDEAGIRIGDKILAIDGEDMKGADVADISSRLKGEPGSDVDVVIERNIGGEIDTMTLTRRRILIPSVPYAGVLRDGIGYITHNDFIEGSYDEMRRAVEMLMATDSLKGIVLDYRSNGGGVMQEAVDILSLFVPRGTRVVSIMGRDSSSLQHLETRYAPIAENIPLVVLVSEGSASASEILSGSLQDLDRAVIMGSRTYGKGLVQGTRYVGYNSYLKYTTSKYYVHSGRCIHSRDYSTLRSEGVVTTVPDSLIREYRTRGGRRVYDGGGIVPDVKVGPEYISRFAVMLYSLGYTEDWADGYMRRNHDKSIDVRTFAITDADYADFCAFMADKDVPYESQTRKALGQLDKALENDLYSESLGPIVEELRSQLRDDTMSNLETYAQDVRDIINADIVLRYAYSEGVVEYQAVHDSIISAAEELLLDSEEYCRILREQDVDMH